MADDRPERGDLPLVSVVIPTYNVENYIVECLDSVTSQDYPSIEVIAVDDGSTDGSLKVLEDYAAAHPQVKVRHQDNSGAGVARNNGISASRGKYILFIDPDDAIEPGTIGELVEVAEAKRTDIVIFCLARYDDEIRRLLNQAVMPPQVADFGDVFAGADIADVVYNTFKDGPSPCNKFFRRQFITDNRLEFQALPRVNDLCFAYSSLAFAKRIHAVDKAYYKYRTGRKGSSQNTTDRDPTPVCAAYARLKQVLSEAGVFEKFSKSFYKAFYMSCKYTFGRMKKPDTARKLLSRLRSDGADGIAGARLGRDAFESDAEYEEYADFWSTSEPYRLMLGYNERVLADEMPDYAPAAGRKPLGILCGAMRPGGIERALTHLIPMFISNGYDIILMTRRPPTPEEYPLPDGCLRIVVGGEKDRSHCGRIRAAIRKYGIDTVIAHEYYLLTVGKDVDAIHSAGAKAVVHHHSVFSNMYLRDDRERALPMLLNAYRSADALITLSDTDACFLDLMGCKAMRITDPVPAVPRPDLESRRPGHVLIWTARFVDGKRPLDAVKIFEQVLDQVPDARLVMLGDGEAAQVAAVNAYLEDRPGLKAAIQMPGFKSNVLEYEQNADVFLTTSRFDGFSLSVVEAKAMGLPVVAYAMPYLETVSPGSGAISVPQGDVAAAADAIVSIFRNDRLRAELSRQARESYEHFASHDQWESYSRLFRILDGAEAFPAATPDAATAKIIVETLIEHADIAFARIADVKARQIADWKLKLERANRQIKLLRKKQETLKRQSQSRLAQAKSLKNSEAYRIGMAATWPARKAWGGVKCLRENGMAYTAMHLVGKIARALRINCKW